MHGTAIICLTLVTVAVLARPENSRRGIREDTESVRLPPDDSAARDANKFAGKSRSKRTLVLLMPMEDEEKENLDDCSKDTSRRSRKTKRCKSPIGRTRLSLPLNAQALHEDRDENSGEYVGDQEPKVRLISLQNSSPVLKDILTSQHFAEDDDVADRDESVRILKAIREHLKNSKDDIFEDRPRGRPKVNGNKYVCYCHEDDDSYVPLGKESTRDFAPKQASLPRREKSDRNNLRKFLEKEDARRKRPNHVNVPDHRTNPQRLTSLYPEIHRPRPYIPKHYRPPHRNIDGPQYMPFFYNGRPQIALPPLNNLPRNDPAGIGVAISQDDFPIDEANRDGYIVGSARHTLTTGSSEESPDDLEKPPRTYVQTSTPVGTAFLNIDECVKLYGRDVCVISATSAKAFADGNTRRNDCVGRDYSAKSDGEGGSKDHRVYDQSGAYGTTEYTSTDFTLDNKADTTPFGQELTGTAVTEYSAGSRSGPSGEEDKFEEEGDVKSSETVGSSHQSDRGLGDKNDAELSEIAGSGYNADRAIETTSFHSTADSSSTKDWDGTITIATVEPETSTRAGNSVGTDDEVTPIIGKFTDPVENAYRTSVDESLGAEGFRTSESFETADKVTNSFMATTSSTVDESIATISSEVRTSDKSKERRLYKNDGTIVGSPTSEEETGENEQSVNSGENVGAPHTASGKGGPTMLGQGSVDSFEIKEVTNGYFTSKAYDNETDEQLNNWPTSYDDLFATGGASENASLPRTEISDVNLQSKLDEGERGESGTGTGESVATTVHTDANENDEQSSIEKTRTALTTSESTAYNAVGKSRASQEESATTELNDSGGTSTIENESDYNTDGISAAEDTTVRITEALTENGDGILEGAENVTEAPTPNKEFSVECTKESSSTELPQSEDSTVPFKKESEQLLEKDINSSSVDETVVGAEEPSSFTDYDSGTENVSDTVPESLTEDTDSEIPEYQDDTEVAEDSTNSDEESVAATGPRIYEDYADESTTMPSENQDQDTINTEGSEKDVEAENPSTERLPFCDNTLLQNSIKAVINNFTTADLDLDDNANEEVVGSAGESLLPEVLAIPNLQGILSIPQIEKTIVDRVKSLLSRITGIPKRKLLNDWSTNVIRNSLQHTMSAAPKSHGKLPAMTVEERQFKDGEWVTHLVTLAPIESEEEESPTELKRLRNKVHGLLRDPAISLEAVRKPIVQSMIVQSVRNSFEPVNRTVDETFNDPEVRDFLDNMWTRFDEMGGDNDENPEETGAPLGAEQIGQDEDENSSTTLGYGNFEKWLDSNVEKDVDGLFGSDLDTTQASDISAETTVAPSSTSSSEVLGVTHETGDASDSLTAETHNVTSIVFQPVEETSSMNENDVSSTSTYLADSTESTTSAGIKLEEEEEESLISNTEATEMQSATEVSVDEISSETIPTTSENFVVTDPESSNIVGVTRIHSQDSTTINPTEELLTDETEIHTEDVEISEQSSSVAPDITSAFSTSYPESATDVENTETGDSSYDKSSTKYYSPTDRILHYIKTHRANDADGRTEGPVGSSTTTDEQYDQTTQENALGSSPSDSGNITSNSSEVQESSTERNVRSSELQQDEEVKDSSTEMPDEDSSDDYIEGISKSSDATTSAYSTKAKSYIGESSKVTKPVLFITPTFDVYGPEESGSTTQNVKDFSKSLRRIAARENAARSQGAFTTARNREVSPAEWYEDYTAANGGLVKTHEITTEIQRKVTKTTKYFGKVRNGAFGKRPSTSPYSSEQEEPVDEVLTGTYEDVNENGFKDGDELLGDQRHADFSTEFSTDVTATEKDPTYFGKISLERKKGAPSGLRDLEGSELFYIGDGVKLPLEVRKLNDGSYALSISRKVCEHILNRKCPCCVPHGGSIVRAVRSKGNGNEVIGMRTATDRMQERRARTTSELLREISGQQVSRPDTLNKRNTRELDVSNELEHLSMPVEIFIKKYNLSLDLQNVQDPWNVESKSGNNLEVKTIKKKRDKIDDDLGKSLLSIDNALRIEETDSSLDSSKNIAGPIDLQNSGEDHTENNLNSEEDERIYGYQTNNPILDRITFLKGKRKNSKQYRYQRNTNDKSNRRTAIMKTVLSWLKGLVLSTDAKTSTDR